MTLLNPLALLFMLSVLWFFRATLFTKSTLTQETFLQEHKLYATQTKMIIFALLFTLLALARPAMVNEITQEKFDANEYILAIDASYSMQADDLAPSRYEVAKKSLISLLKKDAKDRFTLFAFTKNPLLISPPTTDQEISISALNALQPKYILTKGTSLTALLKRVASLEQEHKSLIIFTDGGEEHNLNQLLKIALKNAITINIVATASKDGAVLQKNGHALKDSQAHLIVSRINPILKDLAQKSGGFYIELLNPHKDISSKLYTMMQEQVKDAKELSTDVVSYKELYFIPLLIAFILLLLSLTQAQKLLPLFTFMLFISFSHDAEASLLDFHYNKLAKEAYQKKEYTKAINYYKKLSASQYSYMSIANAYYKDKQYRNALRYYAEIKTKDRELKSILFYNMANAAVRLKKYNRAKKFYEESLALSYSKEAKENLLTLYRLRLKPKVNVADMLPTVDDKKVKNITKKNDTKKDDKEQGSNSNDQQRASQGSQGGKGSENKKESHKSNQLKSEENEFKMGYNAYELINKGYVNEKKPW